jgi:hypothetical protein
MTLAIVLTVVAFLVVGVMLGRQSSKTKRSAVADLEAEKENVGSFDIFALVESEVTELGLLEIEGSSDVPHGVLLKTWSDNSDIAESCIDHARLRFVVADGVNPPDARDGDVTLECSATKPVEQP